MTRRRAKVIDLDTHALMFGSSRIKNPIKQAAGRLGGQRRKETTTREQRQEWGRKGRRVRDAKIKRERIRLRRAYKAELRRVTEQERLRFDYHRLVAVRSILTQLSEPNRLWTMNRPVIQGAN